MDWAVISTTAGEAAAKTSGIEPEQAPVADSAASGPSAAMKIPRRATSARDGKISVVEGMKSFIARLGAQCEVITAGPYRGESRRVPARRASFRCFWPVISQMTPMYSRRDGGTTGPRLRACERSSPCRSQEQLVRAFPPGGGVECPSVAPRSPAHASRSGALRFHRRGNRRAPTDSHRIARTLLSGADGHAAYGASAATERPEYWLRPRDHSQLVPRRHRDIRPNLDRSQC